MFSPEQISEPAVLEAQAVEAGAYVFHDEAILGTRMQIQLVARNLAAAKTAALSARSEIDRLNLILNSLDPRSELYRLNESKEHTASPELFAVVELAERWRLETSGAYSGRLGRIVDAWRKADRVAPSRAMLARLAREADEANVVLHSGSRVVVRPGSVQFAFDAIAKGWIVDRAFEVAMQSTDISGALVDIGGEIRCGGAAPQADGWCVGVNDPLLPFDNAPLVARANLSKQGFDAIATSGRGPRDRVIDGVRYSATLSPFDGWPVKHHVSVSAVASSVADADALATAMMVLPTEQAIDLANRHAIPARITADDHSVKWTRLAQPNSPDSPLVSIANTADAQGLGDWQPGWQALATFTAPRRQLIRDPDFRSPYMAMWITDEANNPIRTLILIGKQIEWQKDNYIWWSINRNRTSKLVATRSMSTSGAGVYNVFWDGVDDVGKTVPAGKYVLHVETSRERGKHTYRSLELNFEKFARFVNVLPPTEEGGGLRVSFDHY